MKCVCPPVKPGDPCWSVAYAEEMWSPIAQLGSEFVDWFLATHSPITCKDSRGLVTERELFEEIFSTRKLETLIVVKGEPGAGKSQLINWLKLRFDDALSKGGRLAKDPGTLKTVLPAPHSFDDLRASQSMPHRDFTVVNSQNSCRFLRHPGLIILLKEF